ncbi:ATP-binding protein [Streptomyces sp. NRRL B-2790]|uniref:ATP-binding protein n=1 Tax=Streptomyces sp. NRRL B-2790 TaxID=1463835 RepID=UPI0035620150
MKQSAVKTLGVAALGAAFAAVGAGAANAAPAAQDATQALGTVASTLPAQNVSQALPGAGQALAQGQSTVGAGTATAQSAVPKVPTGRPATQVSGLLGGLPLQDLPTQGAPVNGVHARTHQAAVRALSSDGSRIHSAM